MVIDGRPQRRIGPPITLVVALIPMAVAVNYIANLATRVTGVPLYLDTVGTFLAAVLLGPWWGALTGLLTNAVPVLLPPNDVANLLFAPVNVVAALVWGYALRPLGLGRSAIGFFLVAVLVGVVTGILATPIVLFLFGGSTGHPSDLITAAFASFGLERAALVSNMLSSVPDKVISAYLGLAITAALPTTVLAEVRLPGPPGTRRLVLAVAGVVIGIALTAIVVLTQAPA